MAIYNSLDFNIGTADGEYPAGTTITDTVFEHCPVSSITTFGQSYNFGFTVNSRTLNLGFAVNNGEKITVNFKCPLIIQ